MSRQTSQQDTHYRTLRLLEENPDLTQREIAKKLGVSLGSTNYCLKALVDKGLVKIRNFRASKNKLGYAYLLTPRGVKEKLALTEGFLKRKLIEYEALKAEIEALQAENLTAEAENSTNKNKFLKYNSHGSQPPPL